MGVDSMFRALIHFIYATAFFELAIGLTINRPEHSDREVLGVKLLPPKAFPDHSFPVPIRWDSTLFLNL